MDNRVSRLFVCPHCHAYIDFAAHVVSPGCKRKLLCATAPNGKSRINIYSSFDLRLLLDVCSCVCLFLTTTCKGHSAAAWTHPGTGSATMPSDQNLSDIEEIE